jgi:hypothetical protein
VVKYGVDIGGNVESEELSVVAHIGDDRDV